MIVWRVVDREPEPAPERRPLCGATHADGPCLRPRGHEGEHATVSERGTVIQWSRGQPHGLGHGRPDLALDPARGELVAVEGMLDRACDKP